MAMRRHDPNRHQLTAVASALGDALREQLVFVGGSIAGLLLDDPAAGEIRATTDVDAIVEARLGQFHAIEEQVAQRGFSRDTDSEVICRWRHRNSGILFDLMPADDDVLGFSNRWYPLAVRTAQPHDLGAGLHIRLISAPLFVATKLEAFVTRGHGDVLASHDLEDILNVVEGRPGLDEELRAADPELLATVRTHFRALLAQADFTGNLAGLVSDPDMAAMVLGRLNRMTD